MVVYFLEGDTLMNYFFTIIVPVYNRENTIKMTIESVLEQNYDEYELILIDDGSIDKTGNICKYYAKNDARVKYFYKENEGVSIARNLGIHKSNGEYILFLDSDNLLTSDALAILKKKIIDNKYPDLLCFGFETSTTSFWKPKVDTKNDLVISHDLIKKQILPTHLNIYSQNSNFLHNFVWNKCYKKSFLVHYNIQFDENRIVWEDGHFIIECLANVNTIAIMQDVIYIAHIDKKVDHLSNHVFLHQLRQYVNDEKEFKNRFERLFSFNTYNYFKSNFNILCNLLEKIISKYGKSSYSEIKKVFDDPIIEYWMNNIIESKNYNFHEKIIIKCIQKKNINKLALFFRIKRFFTKLNNS